MVDCMRIEAIVRPTPTDDELPKPSSLRTVRMTPACAMQGTAPVCVQEDARTKSCTRGYEADAGRMQGVGDGRV